MTSIYGDPAVIRRIEARTSFQKITSNGTVAAAIMVLAALVAVAVANSDAYEAVHEFLEAPLTLGVGSFAVSISVEAFVNDFLMAIFFLLVGVELKYELTVGVLTEPRQAAAPCSPPAAVSHARPSSSFSSTRWEGGTQRAGRFPLPQTSRLPLGS